MWNGMQSHCGALASNTRRYFPCDVVSKFLLAARTFCTVCCARFLGRETCCIFPPKSADAVVRHMKQVAESVRRSDQSNQLKVLGVKNEMGRYKGSTI